MKKLLLLAALMFTMPAWAVDCYVSAYEYVTIDKNGVQVQAVLEPALSVQQITFTTTSTATVAFPARTSMVRIVCTAKAHFEFGTAPVASSADPFLSANTPEYFGIVTASTLVAFQDGN